VWVNRQGIRAKPRKVRAGRLPAVEYEADEIVRRAPDTKDYIRFGSRLWKAPQAFRGERVATRPLHPDGCYGVFSASHQVAAIDLRQPAG